MKCFYHSADLDGHCSGAIVLSRYPECEMHGINYGQPFPWDTIDRSEDVIMVDFTLQPFDLMEKLRDSCNLTWIDHHKIEVLEATKRNFTCRGLRIVGKGACELTWEYYRVQPLPLAVKLLSQYDVWDHTDDRTLPFQYGMRQFPDTSPANQHLWQRLFKDPGNWIQKIIDDGAFLMEYEANQNAKFCAAYAFETALIPPPREPGWTTTSYRAICANRGFTNSKLFDSVWDPNKYDLMITFCRQKLPAKQWTVSLYSTKTGIDCGEIAKLYGGGGHPGAAGFQCEELPFVY